MIPALRRQELEIRQLEDKKRKVRAQSQVLYLLLLFLVGFFSILGWIHSRIDLQDQHSASSGSQIERAIWAYGHPKNEKRGRPGVLLRRLRHESNPQNIDGHNEMLLKQPHEYGVGFYPLSWEELKTSLTGKASERADWREDFAVITRKSNQHSFNQDRAAFIRPFRTKQTPTNTSFLVLLLDGHGVEGHLMADYARRAIPQRLEEKLNAQECCENDEWIKQQLNETFLEVNEEAPPTYALRGGCTASVSLLIGSKLFVANTGDSQTIIGRFHDVDNAEVTYSTRPHKPFLPDERARIERMGGRIHTPKDRPKQSRVVAYSVASVPSEPIALAMSRSLGDWEWKGDGVIAEPTVDVLNLTKQHLANETGLFLLAASDGIWDMRPRKEYFAEHFGNLLFSSQSRTVHEFMSQFCDEIVKISPNNPKWYRDDMSAVLVKLR